MGWFGGARGFSMNDKESSDGAIDLRGFRSAALLGVIALAFVELLGWILGWQLQLSSFVRWVPMAPSTSICFILLALQLLLGESRLAGKAHLTVSLFPVFIVIVFCAMGLVDYWGQAVPYIEDRVSSIPGFLNGIPLARMSPMTAGLFLLSAGAILVGLMRSVLARGDGLLGNLGGAFGSIVTFGGFTLLLGYVYGTPFLYGGTTVPVAATTSTAFLFLGFALLIDLKPHDFPKRHFVGSPVHTRLVRGFVPLVFFAVLLQGIVGRFAPLVFDVSNALLSALLAVAIAVLAVIAVSRTASVVGSAVDKAEESLAKAVKEWELTFDSVSDFVMILDNEHRIVKANQALAKRLGVSQEEVVGRFCFEAVHGEEEPPSFCPHSLLLKDGKEQSAEFLEPRLGAVLDGRVFPLVDEEGHVFGAVHVVRDITERKRADEALRQSEERYRKLVDTMYEGLGVLDENGAITYVNDRACRIVGYRREELLGRHPSNFLDETNRQVLAHEMGRREKGEKGSYELEWTRKDGSKSVVVMSGSPILDEQGRFRGSFAVLTDITARKMAEEELRETTEMLNSIIRASPDAIAVLDPEGAVRMWNPAAHKIFGWSAGEVLGHPNPMVPKEKQEEFQALRRRVLAGEILAGVELSRRRKGGAEIEISLSAAPLKEADGDVWGILALMTDVTERKKTEAVQRRLATAVEQSVESVMITDPSGYIEYVNPSFERISGYEKEEVLGRKPKFLKSDEHDDAFYKELEAGVRSGKPWKGRIISKRKDGKLYHEDVTISPVRDSAGAVVSYVDVGHDVTEQVLLQKQLFQAQKMEAVGTLAGGIAHDFNNLLQIILGYSELVLLHTSEEDSRHQEVRAIRQAAARGADLVQQILTFSRKIDTKPRPMNLNRRIMEAHTLLARTLPKMIDIQLLLADDLKTINADPGQLEQVLLNLAVNAGYAMPQGGSITIKTENVVLDDDYTRTHFGVIPGEYALLTFSDTGHGMDKQVVEHIFEPFYTTKGAEEGTGLGLAMVFGIVKGHGGHVECYSEPGEGTTFRIYLPVIESVRMEDVEIPEAPLACGTETVLLVDDEELIVALGRRILSRGGYTVLTSTRAREALEIYRAKKGDIDLVIIDLIMPELGGKELFEELLKIDPEVKVVVASGYSADRLLKDTAGVGPAGFLGKPYRMRQMLQVVRDTLDGGRRN